MTNAMQKKLFWYNDDVFSLLFCNGFLAIKLLYQQSCIWFGFQNNLKELIVFAPFSKELCNVCVFNKRDSTQW